MTNQPPFIITSKINNLVAEIAEKLGKIQGAGVYNRNLHLRKVNRLRTIHSSIAIEGNTLSIEQVSDVVNGKKIIGSLQEIKEVQNAYKVYDNLLNFNPYSVDDFLTAHKLMTSELIEQSGQFRKGNVGVYSGSNVIHLGANPQFVPTLIKDLFEWAKISDVHPLIKSSVIHFEIEFIHPFADGNGRMGRFWQTLILSRWHEIFGWIPTETLIHEHQQLYYKVLGNAEKTASSTEFIEFMLDIILKTLKELPEQKITDIIPDKITDKLKKSELQFLNDILGYIQNNEYIDSYKAQNLTNKSPESVKKYFAAITAAGILIPVGKNKGRKYRLNLDFS